MRKNYDVASKAVFVLLTLFASSCAYETIPSGVDPFTTGTITSTTPFYWTSTGETKTVSAYYPSALASASTLTIQPVPQCTVR